MESHLTPELFGQFLQGACKSEQAAYVEAHIDGCGECRQVLSNLVRSQRDQSLSNTDVISPPKCPVAVGDVVAGKYRIEKVVGTGGMGSVVAAWHGQLNHRVALKFMLPQFASDAEAAARFSREARSAARLRSPHVCRVLDLDKLANGTPFLVMEYLEGETLEQHLERDRVIAPARAVDWVLQALEALAEAHGVGIIHRDLKPANLFVTQWQGQETIKVLDFGIAKSVDPDIEYGLKSTSQNMMIGSPPFMAPEQLQPGKKVDARADVWSMGVVLYQSLTGELPFKSDNLVDMMFAIKNQPHPPLLEKVPSLPAAVVQVVDVCLAKAPEDRFQTVDALVQALKAARFNPSAGLPAPAAMKSLPAARSSRAVWVVLAVASLVAVAVTAAGVRSAQKPLMPETAAVVAPASRHEKPVPMTVFAPLPEVQTAATPQPPQPLLPAKPAVRNVTVKAVPADPVFGERR